jgi:hypothetical protein
MALMDARATAADAQRSRAADAAGTSRTAVTSTDAVMKRALTVIRESADTLFVLAVVANQRYVEEG